MKSYGNFEGTRLIPARPNLGGLTTAHPGIPHMKLGTVPGGGARPPHTCKNVHGITVHTAKILDGEKDQAH